MAELHLPQRTLRFCRLCFSKTLVFTSLLSPENTTMLDYLDIKLFVSENNEDMVCCTACDLELKRAYKTRLKFITTQTHLQEYAIVQSMKEEVNEPEVENHILDVLIEEDVDCNVTICVFCNSEIKSKDLTSHLKLHVENTKSEDISNDETDSTSSALVPIKKSKNINLTGKRTLKITPLNDSNKELLNLQIKGIQSRKKYKKTPKVADPKAPYKCPICSREYLTKRKFHAHTHAKKLCPICGKEISVSNFTKHFANHTSGIQICDTCGRTCGSTESLRAHIFNCHRDVVYKCEECDITFGHRHTLHKHKIKEHNKTKNFVCELCGKKFFMRYDLNKHHRMTHLKERNHICRFCNKGFSGNHALRTHVRQHTNETPFRCEICGEGFRQNVSLKGHKKSKHNIVEPITCTCRYCGKGFGSEWALGVHTRLHPEAID